MHIYIYMFVFSLPIHELCDALNADVESWPNVFEYLYSNFIASNIPCR